METKQIMETKQRIVVCDIDATVLNSTEMEKKVGKDLEAAMLEAAMNDQCAEAKTKADQYKKQYVELTKKQSQERKTIRDKYNTEEKEKEKEMEMEDLSYEQGGVSLAARMKAAEIPENIIIEVSKKTHGQISNEWKEIIEELNKNSNFCFVTSNDKLAVEALRQNNPSLKNVKIFSWGELGKIQKPNKEILLAVAEKFGVKAEEATFTAIGDSNKDMGLVTNGKKIGLDINGILYTSFSQKYLAEFQGRQAECFFVAQNEQELSERLQELGLLEVQQQQKKQKLQPAPVTTQLLGGNG